MKSKIVNSKEEKKIEEHIKKTLDDLKEGRVTIVEASDDFTFD